MARLRILVVNWQDRHNPNAAGAEVRLHKVFGRLAQRGHQVTLLCLGWGGASWVPERLFPVTYRGLPRIAVPENTKDDLVRRGLDGADITVVCKRRGAPASPTGGRSFPRPRHRPGPAFR